MLGRKPVQRSGGEQARFVGEKALTVRKVIGDVQAGRRQARQERRTGGGTDRGGGVGIREPKPFGREPIEVRGVDDRVALTSEIHPAEVVDQHEEDVRHSGRWPLALVAERRTASGR